MATYDVAIGIKKVNWNFDNNSSIKVICPFSPTKNASQFTLMFYSTFGSSLIDMEASYLAVDSSLSSYIYFCSGGNYIAIVAQVGQTWPVNFTTASSMSNMAWSGYKSTTKTLVYCPYYQYNPTLGTANHSLGLYIKLTTVSTSAFQFNLVVPFGIDNDTRYDSKVLLADKNIILDVEYLSIGDQLTLKSSFGPSNLFTYTYVTGQGCDMDDNNTFFAL